MENRSSRLILGELNKRAKVEVTMSVHSTVCIYIHSQLTLKKRSIDSCHIPISSSICWNDSEFKLVTWAGIGYSELKLWFIHTAVSGEWSSPSSDIEDLHAVPQVRVHSSDIQREGRGPGEKDGCLLRVYF